MANVTLIVGLSFGDEGKGSLVDYLVRRDKAHTVVRYNGGAQAAHNVVLADGRHHTFAQFGSGTLVPGCRTHLSRYMLVNPIFLMREEKALQELGVTDAYARLTIERTALITNPFQVAANRLRENHRSRHTGRHGSCGMGIGETMADWATHPEDAIRIEDFESPGALKRKLATSQARKYDELAPILTRQDLTNGTNNDWDVLRDVAFIDDCVKRFTNFAGQIRIVDDTYLPMRLREPGHIVFEGAQGMLLDQNHGFFPFCTRSDITFGNALALIEDFTAGKVTRMGVLRAYGTRHGAGPFLTEDPQMDLPDRHNGNGPWQQAFRVGHLDLVATDYALRAVGGVDEIVMTNVDRLQGRTPVKVCTGYAAGDREDDYLGGLDPYFHVHNGMIDGFKVKPGQTPERLADRTQFTAEMAKLEPDYEEFKNVEEAVAWTAGHLRTPINLCSYGPTANDKRPRC